MFENLGVVSTPKINPTVKSRITSESALLEILTCENSRSFFCSTVGGTPRITNESVKTIVLDKLYSVVANKISKMDVDFQDILKSNGDYLKYTHFKSCDETMKALIALVKENKGNISDVSEDQLNQIFKAHENLIKNVSVFKEAFKFNVGVAKQYYFGIVSSLIYATGFIVTTMIDYERRNGIVDYKIIFKNENILERGMPKNMLEAISQFNKDIETGNLKKCVDAMKNVKPKVASEATTDFGAIAAKSMIPHIIGGVAIGAAVVLGLFMVPAILRHTIYFFLHSKIKLSEYFEQQALFLELSAAKLKRNGTVDPKVAQKQEEYANKLRAFAAKLSGDKYAADKAAQSEIDVENKEIVKAADEEAKKEPKSDSDNGSFDNSDIVL